MISDVNGLLRVFKQRRTQIKRTRRTPRAGGSSEVPKCQGTPELPTQQGKRTQRGRVWALKTADFESV